MGWEGDVQHLSLSLTNLFYSTGMHKHIQPIQHQILFKMLQNWHEVASSTNLTRERKKGVGESSVRQRIWTLMFNICSSGQYSRQAIGEWTEKVTQLQLGLFQNVVLLQRRTKLCHFNLSTTVACRWVILGWVCAARDSNLAPRSKKKLP